MEKILISGGSGLLGKALQTLDHNLIAPSHAEMDVTNAGAVRAAIEKYRPDVFVHCAAFISPPRCDANPAEAAATNILGTFNVVEAAREKNIRVVYVSTDYVFKGDTGMYSEESEVLPQNLYAWTKLGGECAVRTYQNSLIIRTSFCPAVFAHDKAFVDQYTSRDSVEVIAPLILASARRFDVTGVLNVGTERKTIKELAVRLGKPNVGELRRNEVTFKVPADTSLDISKLKNILSL